jgi:penicillin-binding protein-related factor A (putative recombinase)
MFYTKITDKKKLRKFKKRSEPRLDFKKVPHNRRTYIYYPSGGNIELVIYKYIIKAFRRRSRRKRYKLNFFFKPNYVITKKSKNARMGKGKGKFRRFSLKLSKNKFFMAISGLSHHRIVIFFKKIKKTSGLYFLVTKNRDYTK